MINNIYKRKDGRYEGRIPIYNSDGSRKYKYFFDKTKEDSIFYDIYNQLVTTKDTKDQLKTIRKLANEIIMNKEYLWK